MVCLFLVEWAIIVILLKKTPNLELSLESERFLQIEMDIEQVRT